ncbi:DUF3883 domain-containing protein [Caulobacter sp. CCG-8]|uniref:DUF3883 domain-containing protein n=1 Tax=Caulobacter sp. CCG-8 TaxID=3127958 RepID=UPI00307DC343
MPDYKDLASRRAVLAAMASHDEMGREAFLTTYRYGKAESYFVTHEGKSYDSKAIVGVAYGLQYPDRGPLDSDSFSGGRGHAAGHLSRLGFDVAGITRPETDWSLKEVEAVVTRFFRMFVQQGAPDYNRSGQLKIAASEIPWRNDSAISRKISNINAILAEMELPLLRGFGQLPNSQTLLRAVVYDWITVNEDVFGAAPVPTPLHDASRETPPPKSKTMEAVRSARGPVRIDFAASDERNRLLGNAGEAWALAQIKQQLIDAGRPDLAARTIWMSRVVGDGLGYDISSFTTEGLPIQVEVKTTNGGLAAPFFVSANEVQASADARDAYVLMRIYSFASEPRYYRLVGPLETTCQLRPATYRALPAS